MEYPLKHIRLEQLNNSGFNTPNFIHFPSRKLNLVELKRFFNKYKIVSCRNFHSDESKYFACPVMYEIDTWKTLEEFASLHNKKFHTLCNEALPLQDSQYAGVILLIDKQNYIVEYFEGEGTPRDIESRSVDTLKVFKREFGKSLPAGPVSLIDLPRKFYNFLPEQRPISLEFSIYPYSVGKLKRNEIFWEWRKGWLHDTLEIVRRLLSENQELKAAIRALTKVYSMGG